MRRAATAPQRRNLREATEVGQTPSNLGRTQLPCSAGIESDVIDGAIDHAAAVLDCNRISEAIGSIMR